MHLYQKWNEINAGLDHILYAQAESLGTKILDEDGLLELIRTKPGKKSKYEIAAEAEVGAHTLMSLERYHSQLNFHFIFFFFIFRAKPQRPKLPAKPPKAPLQPRRFLPPKVIPHLPTPPARQRPAWVKATPPGQERVGRQPEEVRLRLLAGS